MCTVGGQFVYCPEATREPGVGVRGLGCPRQDSN